MNNPVTVWFFIRYGVTGACGGLLQTGTLYVWVSVLHLESYYLCGAALGFFLALSVTFFLQKYWTFRDYRRAPVRRQFFLYTLVAGANLALNIMLLSVSKLGLEMLGFDFFRLWYLLAQAVSIIVLAAVSFSANYFVTFRARSGE